MNKQEIVEKIKVMTVETFFSETLFVNQKEVIKLIEQLDEPQKPVVSQMVADWYEENKDHLDYNLWDIIVDMGDKEIEQPEIAKWINVTPNAITTIVNMHQFGYEVEKEKRYLVKVKNVLAGSSCLIHGHNNEWYYGHYYDSRCGVHHTRKELEDAGFGWVFDCSGIEIEEVEE